MDQHGSVPHEGVHAVAVLAPHVDPSESPLLVRAVALQGLQAHPEGLAHVRDEVRGQRRSIFCDAFNCYLKDISFVFLNLGPTS